MLFLPAELIILVPFLVKFGGKIKYIYFYTVNIKNQYYQCLDTVNLHYL